VERQVELQPLDDLKMCVAARLHLHQCEQILKQLLAFIRCSGCPCGRERDRDGQGAVRSA
jgi:hypothetical protein